VLLDRHGAQAVQVGAVVPAEVGVRVAQPGHQGAAAALDDPRSGGGVRVHGADRGDAVVLDQHVAGVGIGAGGVEDRDISEEDLVGADGHVGASCYIGLIDTG
jgi:hypothetical protein